MRSLHSGTPFTAAANRAATLVEPSPGKREWTISEMARDFGLTLRALRFYESRGLIAPQRFGGARYYSAKDRVRINLILTAKRMGFTLAEAADMIGKDAGETINGDIADLPISSDAIESQIAFLETQRAAIDTAIGTLRGRQKPLAGSVA